MTMAFNRRLIRISIGAGSCLAAGSVLNLFKSKSEPVNSESKGQSGSRPGPSSRELEGYELKMVQILVRHGARTPLHLTKNVEEVTYDKSMMLAVVPHTTYNYREVSLDGGPRPFSPYEHYYRNRILKGGSRYGTLTATGQEQMYIIGKLLRQQYVGEGKLLSHYSAEHVYARSTNIDRTIATARSVLAGMFGQSNLNSLADPVQIYVGNPSEDELLPRTGVCHVLRQINHASMIHGGNQAELKNDRLKIENLLGIEPDGTEGKHILNFIDLRDDLVARQTHGLSDIAVLRPFRDVIEKNAVTLMYYAFCGQHEAERTLAMRLSNGPLMRLVISNMDKVDSSSTKLYLYSCHDSSLMGMLGCLDIFDNKWPPFGADIRFELYENASKEKFIRVSYLGEDKVVRGCSSELCPLSEFKQAMEPYSIQNKEYKQVCSSNILEVIAKEILEQEKGEIEDTETKERSDIPAGM